MSVAKGLRHASRLCPQEFADQMTGKVKEPAPDAPHPLHPPREPKPKGKVLRVTTFPGTIFDMPPGHARVVFALPPGWIVVPDDGGGLL